MRRTRRRQNSKVWCFLVFMVALIGIYPSLVLAQTTTGTILGVVTDETGGVLPGVEVLMTNLETGVTRTAITDDEGRYRAPNLTLGNYEIQATLTGFQAGVRTGLTLTVGREAVVDITLQVGAITERVVVEGEAPLVESTTSTITSLVGDKEIRDLPLNGRSFTQLAMLQEGVLSPANYETGQPGNEGQKLSIGGTRITQTAFLIDGTDIRNQYGTTPGSVGGVLLGVETVREFTVVTSAASAEYGGFTGGVVNAVSRSGTNQLHGSVFEFHRNSALDARNFFDLDPKNPLQRSKVPHFIRNQFGFTIGGPIVPDKTFFFGSYEGLRDRFTTTDAAVVPDENARNGILPSGNITVSPKVQPYLDLYPLPNAANFGDGSAEFIFSNPIPTDEDYFMVKVDHNFSDSDSMFVRYTLDDSNKTNLSAIPNFEELRINRAQFLTIEEKKILSPTLINEFRFAFNRSRSDSGSEPIVPIDESLQYIPLPDRTFGAMGATGFTAWGPGALTKIEQVLNRFEVANNLTYISGRHTIKAGFKWTRLQFNITNGIFADGLYIFTSLPSFLQARPLLVIAVLGDLTEENPPPPFIPGIVGPVAKQGLRESMFGMYVQDDFQWTSNLTLNLGLRYSFITNPTEVAGRISNVDEPTDTVIRLGNPLLARNPSLKSFAPRVGLSWDPFGDGKGSVRAGAGIFYDFLGAERLLGPQGGGMPPFFTAVRPFMPDFPNFFDDVAGALAQPQSIFSYRTPKQSYVIQYSLTVQREIAPQTVLTVGYQGSRGVHLGRLLDANLAPEQVVDGKYFWPESCSAQIRRGEAPQPGCSAPQNSTFGQMRMYYWDGNSFYNSFRLGLRKRFSQGFQFQSAYTYGRAVDESSNTANFDSAGATSSGITNSPFDHKLDRGLASFDVRHHFTFNATFELPFGSGKPLGNSLQGVVGKLISGWKLSPIVRLSSGFPVNMILGNNQSRSGATQNLHEHPDLASGRSNNPVQDDGRNPNQYFDPTAFELQPPGFYGNVARNTLIGPGIATFDLSLAKDTALAGEDLKLQFRAEFFNVFNRANFGRPAGTIFSNGRRIGNAGRITDTLTTSRQIQFALKLIF